MKSSLIWRFIVIVAVLAAWTYSMFPLKDRDYMLTFRQTAENIGADLVAGFHFTQLPLENSPIIDRVLF